MTRFFVLVLAVSSLLFVSACGFSTGQSASPPTDLQIVAGDSSVTAKWTMAPDVQYWLLLAPATSISTSNWTSLPGARSVINAVSPQLVSGLSNGQIYSFVMDARVNSGPAGSSTVSVSATPRSAGSSWSSGTSLGSMNLRGVAYNPLAITGSIAAVAVGSNGAIFSSLDGVNWTAQSNPAPTSNLNAAIFGGYYMAAGAGGAVLTSTDAITWTKQTTGTSNDLNGLATNGAAQYVAAGANGTIIASGSGVNWGIATSGTTNNLNAVTYGNGRYVAVGANGTLLSSADSGVTWVAGTSNTTNNLNGVAYGSWLVTATGAIVTSFVAVGANGTIITSPDGLTWTTQTAVTSNTLTAVDFGRVFVAISSNGGILTSSDGTAWLAQTAATSNALNAIAHSAIAYFAVGAAGTNLSSF